MKQVFIALSSAALLLAVPCSGIAQTPVQFPSSGAVVFTAQLPPGWKTSGHDTSLDMVSTALGLSVGLMVFNDPALAQIPLDTLAPQILKSANATPPTGHEPITISGVSGTTYFSTISPNGVQLTLNLALFQINGASLAGLEVAMPNPISRDQKAALDQVVNTIALKVAK
jgi:hypothetical protein